MQNGCLSDNQERLQTKSLACPPAAQPARPGRPEAVRKGPSKVLLATGAFSAELEGPRTLLRIRLGIFDFQLDFGLNLGQTKPKISGTVPTSRHTTNPNDSGSISESFNDDPKLKNCEIAQPRFLSGLQTAFRCVSEHPSCAHNEEDLVGPTAPPMGRPKPSIRSWRNLRTHPIFVIGFLRRHFFGGVWGAGALHE